jgi:vacuolar-type H+-ATPase subunit H
VTEGLDQSWVDAYERAGREVSTVLLMARESAEKLRLEAEDQARSMERDAQERCADILRRAQQQAKREAAAALDEARDRAERLIKEARAMEHDARQGVADVLRQAEDQAAATLQGARDQAEHLINEAQRHAKEQRRATEVQCSDLLSTAMRRYEQLRGHERELRKQIEQMEKALRDLTSTLVENGVSTSHVLNAGLGGRRERTAQVIDLRRDES